MGNSCGKILQQNLREIVAGNCFGKLLRENHAGNCCGKSCGKLLQENCSGKLFWEILAGQGGGEKANFRKAVIGGNLVFGIG